jgi:hypothetical protein
MPLAFALTQVGHRRLRVEREHRHCPDGQGECDGDNSDKLAHDVSSQASADHEVVGPVSIGDAACHLSSNSDVKKGALLDAERPGVAKLVKFGAGAVLRSGMFVSASAISNE